MVCVKYSVLVIRSSDLNINKQMVTFVFKIAMCLLFLLSSVKGDQNVPTQHQHTAELMQLTAVSGSRTSLSCDITPATVNDTLLLVVWYKEDIPIYSYDTRGGSLKAGTHWADNSALAGRASFRIAPSPSTLALQDATEKDAGEYRCRVDFKIAPTRYFRINLDVIVLPENPKIFDERGQEVVSRAGPYYEGADLSLTCMVTGGKPTPSLSWYRGDDLVESAEITSGFVNKRASQLKVRELNRSDQHARFTCKAFNTPLAAPLIATVAIEMYLKPDEVEILSREHPLSADQTSQLSCRSTGAWPSANLSWFLEGVPLHQHQQLTIDDDKVTVSTLSLTPTLDDNEKTLTCRAENPKIDYSAIDTAMQLSISFVPIVSLQLGATLNPNDIEESDDVYFECNVRANPPAYKVIWEHNGQPMHHNQRLGVIANSAHLALQGVGRDAAGNYTCAASNVEGDGRSSPLTLNIMYKPVCRGDVPTVYGVARHERVRVLCSVDAFPPPDTFSWSFNNTAHSFDVPEERYIFGESAGGIGKSILTFTPVSEMDYGTLLCWPANLAGTAKYPCAFTLIPAGPPEMPYNCTAHNQTSESMEISCIPGYNGGAVQAFLLEVWDQRTGELLANITTKKLIPYFIISGLAPGLGLSMQVTAVNDKGRSEPFVLEGYTLKMAEKQTGSNKTLDVPYIFGILIGILVTMILIAIIAVVTIKLRERMSASYIVQTSKQSKSSASNSVAHDRIIIALNDEKNPDVVPANKCSASKAVYLPVSSIERLPSKQPEPPPYSRAPPSVDRIAEGAPFAPALSSPGAQGTQPDDEDRGFDVVLPMSKETLRYEADGLDSSLLPSGLRAAPVREIVTTRTPLLSSEQESCV